MWATYCRFIDGWVCGTEPQSCQCQTSDCIHRLPGIYLSGPSLCRRSGNQSEGTSGLQSHSALPGSHHALTQGQPLTVWGAPNQAAESEKALAPLPARPSNYQGIHNYPGTLNGECDTSHSEMRVKGPGCGALACEDLAYHPRARGSGGHGGGAPQDFLTGLLSLQRLQNSPKWKGTWKTRHGISPQGHRGTRETARPPGTGD